MFHGPQHSKLTVHLNNLGADFIERGDYAQAIDCLSRAFIQSKHALDVRLAAGGRIGEQYHAAACVIDVWMARETPDDKHQNGDFIYTQPMRVPPKATNPSEISVAVANTFNLAIAYHLASLYSAHTPAFQGNSQDQLLRQALRLYQYTFRLQRTQARSSQSPFFFMACINNIGIVFDNLGERNQSEECFQHLLSLLMYMTSAGAVESSRFEFFFTNTTRLTPDSCAVGAAAA